MIIYFINLVSNFLYIHILNKIYLKKNKICILFSNILQSSYITTKYTEIYNLENYNVKNL